MNLTAEQINAPQVGKIELPADSIRSKIVETYEQFKPSLEAYYDYAQRTAALSEAYHAARLREVFSTVPTEEILVATLDARETPKSLDNFLATFRPGKPVTRIVFDRVNGKYHLFV